jgi:membrane protease YdiL (CAAX protease family)
MEKTSPDTHDPAGSIAPGDLPAALPPEPPRLLLHTVFFGSDGLRAGWSLLLYLATVYMLFVGSSLIRYEVHQWRVGSAEHAASGQAQGSQQTQAAEQEAAEFRNPGGVLLSEGLSFLSVVLATWAMAKFERRPVSVYGLDRGRGVRNFLAGLAWGLALLSLLILTLRLNGLLVFDARLLFGIHALGYAAVWLVGFLLVALFEEYFMRGYLQFTLTRGLSGVYIGLGAAHAEQWGFWTAALLLSFFFGYGHRPNPGESPLGLLSAGLIGVVFCLALWRTGSLWWAIGFHAAWDWAQSFLYGVADSGTIVQGRLFATHPLGRPVLSGGLTGPEGSALILPIVALSAGAILWTAPRGALKSLPIQ